MKPQAAAAFGMILAAGLVSADDGEKARKEFTPSEIKAPFLEQFTADWDSRWSPSSATKEQQGGEVFSYVGQWSVEEPTVLPGLAGDTGLVAKSKAAQHAISAPFDEVVDPKAAVLEGKPLVVQYEAKPQNGLTCGGAYLKLLSESPEGIHAKEFSDKTPYTIMFGPDKCGATNKVHFIFRHKNPKTGELEEKHLKYPPYAKLAKVSSLYTLHVHPNNTYEIFINNESKKAGSLLEDFDPPVNPPKEIDDPKDKKPETWVEEARIADPDATKPDDWDEEAPLEIADESVEKPEGWLDDEPLTVPDPEAVQPEEWDEEEDGEWVAPLVPNPKCEEAPGCGAWTRPVIRNPEYKGKWMAPMIDNPEYKGPWAPRKIDNPDYFEDANPNYFSPMAGIGFELWTMDENILFDNIYVGHSVEDARQLAKEQFDEKLIIEQNREKAEEKKAEAEKAKSTDDFGGLVSRVRAQVEDFAEAVRRDPVDAIKSQPEVAGMLATVVAGLFGLVGFLGAALGGGSSSAKAAPAAKSGKKVDAPKAKTTAVAPKDGDLKQRSKATTAQDAEDDE